MFGTQDLCLLGRQHPFLQDAQHLTLSLLVSMPPPGHEFRPSSTSLSSVHGKDCATLTTNSRHFYGDPFSLLVPSPTIKVPEGSSTGPVKSDILSQRAHCRAEVGDGSMSCRPPQLPGQHQARRATFYSSSEKALSG